MGPGSCSDVLDDHFGFVNWRKRSNFHTLSIFPGRILIDFSPAQQFLSWTKESSQGREEAVVAFKAFDAGIDQETWKAWHDAMENWEKNPDDNVNPYQPTVRSVSFQKVRLRLVEEENKELKESHITDSVSPEASLSSLLIEGIELQELQRHITQEISQIPSQATERARSKILEKANTLRQRIDMWCSTQALQFPSSVIIRAKITTSASSALVADIPLLLPSDLVRHSPCPPTALALQWEYALARDMLESIRQGLLQRTYLYKWKDRYSHGQKSSTRSSSTIAKLQGQINASAECYHIACKALASLAPHLKVSGWENVLKELKPEHIRPLNRDDFDPLLQVEENLHVQPLKEPSWIWCMQGINKDGQKEMQDALRIGWCKARLRALCYQEECVLLQEEMRRVLQTMEYEADVWIERSNTSIGLDTSADYVEGRKAYAHYQCNVRQKMAAECHCKWLKLPSNFLTGEGAISLDDTDYAFV
ncbi:hypothetical protein VKT23_008641 [Stygiomarasmius scandens]|uniref:Uncharacterized protein n=1 Tax=Marasmiellus scandens TaxID=2682957 RepID=A0ABR1JH08_9AGAR